MPITVPVRELRDRLGQLLASVTDRRDHIVITRRGRPAAALIPIDEYEALEETMEILSDPNAVQAIDRGLLEISRGQTVSLADIREELREKASQR